MCRFLLLYSPTTEEVPKRDTVARLKIKVVEKAGVAIKRLLPESEPFKPLHYEREDSLVCRTNRKGPCDRQSVIYEIKCTNVTTSSWEKHRGAHILKKTQSHSTEGINITTRYSNFKSM